jgi:FKBP12-rapamycin complex-associated protein
VLTALLSATDRLIKPYAHSLLNVFLPKARDPQPVVSRHMIESIGLLGSVAGEDLVPFVGEILPLFISALQDPQASNKKKEATLRALSQVCAHTGSVVDPLIQYPELFGVFRKFLVGDKVGIEMKRKVLQAMGVLGALDPYTRKVRLVPDLLTHRAWR